MPRAVVRPTIAIVIAGLLCVNALVQRGITQFREDPDLHYGPSFQWVENLGKVDATAVTIVVVAGLVGGFSGLAADILWMKSDEAWDHGQADRMIPILRTVTILDPHFIDAWRIAGWHWAYNLYVETRDAAIKEQCIQNGIEFLKEGIGWNPDKFDLYFELGWTYFDKMGDYLNAVKYFEDARTKKNAPRKPDYILRMVGHAYERIPDLPSALYAYGRVLDEEASPSQLLFTAPGNADAGLSSGRVSDALREAFKKKGIPVSHDVTYSVEKIPAIWLVTDDRNTTYLVKKEQGKVNVYIGDPIGTGATVTIHQKYDLAWKYYVQADYANALKAINAYLVKEPNGVIGNHLKARIYEKWGKLDEALKAWEWIAKHNHMDKLAPHRIIALQQQLASGKT